MRGRPIPWTAIRVEAVRTGLALGIALAVTIIIVLAVSKDPAGAFRVLLTAPLSTKRTVGIWIDDVAKLTLAGLAFSLVFQARQFALGVQGQVYVGAVVAASIALSPLGSSPFALPLEVVAAMVGGAAYGFIPAYAKVRWGANEIVSSLMLNYIAIDVSNYLLRTALTRPGQGAQMTGPFPPASQFPVLVTGTRIDIGLILSVVTLVVVWFALRRTRWGLKLRLVGHNPRFAEYAGIRASAIMLSAMTASGAIGGLLGSAFVNGKAFGRLEIAFEGGLSFDGLLVAIVARNRPLAVPFIAFAYGYLRQGAALMGIRSDVPSELILIVQAIIILLVSSTFERRRRKVLGSPPLTTASSGGAAAAA